ncbi:hypothetical protein [Paracoccus sp. (in: a-proteobacteria)]|uniref:phosphoribosylanthranilate isomerase n=1 Tax=Paracoccus sp. TaxID=267 RepID=UPI003A85E4EC
MNRIKICGITNEDDLTALAGFPIALYGLWHRCGGAHDLELPQLRDLARDGAGQGTARPCLVTFEADPARLVEVLNVTGIPALQLHGFCLPAQLRAICKAVRGIGRRIEILKVLHMNGSHCAEGRLIDAYRDCDVDGFILDAFEGRRAVGSTGHPVDQKAAVALIPRLAPVPVMLAGGVGPDLLRCAQGSGFAGFDIDSAAREDGHISARAIGALFAALAGRQRKGIGNDAA